MIEKGLSLRKILSAKGMPPRNTFFEWIDSSPEFTNQYVRAINLRAEYKFDSIEQDYLEEPPIDPTTGRIDPAWVNLQRLKIDAKKWELSKMFPRKYSEKMDITSDGEKINSQPIVIKYNDGEVSLSTE